MQHKADNPFAPGAGNMPPLLAGHGLPREFFEGQLAMLEKRKKNRQAMRLIGPRGCGKTGLPRWMEEKAERHDGVHVIAIGANAGKSVAN